MIIAILKDKKGNALPSSSPRQFKNRQQMEAANKKEMRLYSGFFWQIK